MSPRSISIFDIISVGNDIPTEFTFAIPDNYHNIDKTLDKYYYESNLKYDD